MDHFFLAFCSTLPALPFLINTRNKKQVFLLIGVFICIFFMQNYVFVVIGTITTFLLILGFLFFSENNPITSFSFSSLFFCNNLLLQTTISPIIPFLSSKMEWWMIVLFQTFFYVFCQFFLSKFETWLYKKYIHTELTMIFITVLTLIGFLYSIWRNDLPGINAASSGTLLKFTIITALCAILFFLLVVLLFAQRTFAERTRIAQEKAELENSKFYYQELAKNAQQIRNFKHDFHNLCLGMKLIIEKGQINEIKEYFEEYIEKPSNQLSKLKYNLSALEKLDSIPLKSLFHTKLGILDPKCIHLSMEIDSNICFPEFCLPNLLRGLGIILDNALEELAFLGEGELNLGVIQEGCDICIIVENTCRDNLPPLHEHRRVGFSTKGENRGFGLASLESCLAEAPFLLRTQILEDRYIQVIIIEGSKTT